MEVPVICCWDQKLVTALPGVPDVVERCITSVQACRTTFQTLYPLSPISASAALFLTSYFYFSCCSSLFYKYIYISVNCVRWTVLGVRTCRVFSRVIHHLNIQLCSLSFTRRWSRSDEESANQYLAENIEFLAEERRSESIHPLKSNRVTGVTAKQNRAQQKLRVSGCKAKHWSEKEIYTSVSVRMHTEWTKVCGHARLSRPLSTVFCHVYFEGQKRRKEENSLKCREVRKQRDRAGSQ